MSDFSIRRADAADAEAVSRLVGSSTSTIRDRFGNVVVGAAIEHHFLSMLATAPNGNIAGFLSLHDTPHGMTAEQALESLPDDLTVSEVPQPSNHSSFMQADWKHIIRLLFRIST